MTIVLPENYGNLLTHFIGKIPLFYNNRLLVFLRNIRNVGLLKPRKFLTGEMRMKTIEKVKFYL